MSTGQRVVVEVVNKLGDIDKAAESLGIRTSVLLSFLDGTRNVPDAVLLRAVDVLEEFPELPGKKLKVNAEQPPEPLA